MRGGAGAVRGGVVGKGGLWVLVEGLGKAWGVGKVKTGERIMDGFLGELWGGGESVLKGIGMGGWILIFIFGMG